MHKIHSFPTQTFFFGFFFLGLGGLITYQLAYNTYLLTYLFIYFGQLD